MFSTTTVFGLALASLATAQSTVSLLVPGADQMPLIASIIASNDAATTYAVQCPSGTDASDCGIADGIILTQGPKTLGYTLSLPYEYGSATVLGYAFSASLACSLGGTTAAVCTESIGGDEANFPGISTMTLTGTDLFYQAVTLTTSSLAVSGVDAVVSATTTPNSSPASTTGTSPGSTQTSGSSSTGRSSSGTTTRPTSTGTNAGAAATSSTSTGGLAMVTGNAQWVIGGAALAAALL